MTVPEYLNTLKTKEKLSWLEISNLSGVPAQTVRNIFSGDTENPGILALSAIVYALGGSLDDMLGHARTDDTAAMDVLRAEYEDRIACIKAEYHAHIKEISDTLDRQRTESARREEFLSKSGDRKVYFVIAATALLMMVQGVVDVFLFRTLL